MEMNRLYKIAIEQSGIGLFMYNSKTKLFNYNNNLFNIFEEKISSFEDIKSFVYNEDLDKFNNNLKKDDSKFDFRIKTKSNKIKYIDFIYNRNNFIISGICHDITKEKEKDHNIIEEKRQISDIFDAIPAFVYYKDKENNFIRVNQSLANMIGKDKTQIEGKNLKEIYKLDHAEKYAKDDLKVIASKKPQIGIIDIMECPDGTIKWYNTSKAPCFGIDGEPIGIIGFSFDITDQYISDKKIKENEETYRTIVKNAIEPIILTDNNGDIILTNNIMISILKISYDEIIGKKLNEFVCDDYSFNTIEEINKNRTKSLKDEIRLKTFTGECAPFNMSYCPININSHFKGGVYILSDISERIEKENIFKEMNLKLKKKNEELESFTSSVSHDLKAPVRQIKMFSDITINAINNNKYESVKKNLIKIKESCSRMQELINDLLTLSRISTIKKKFEYYKLSEIIGNAMDNMESDIIDTNTNINIESDLLIYSDKIQMIQLFQNLISNSIKFRRKNDQCKINVKYIDGNIIYSDNGIGFDNKYNQKIFEMFERLYSSDAYEGNGIGLTICKKIIEEHGWLIKAKGEINSGCEFIIEIPESRRDNVRKI